MLKQIRWALGNRDMKEGFDVFVEIDETYVEGKPRKENKKLIKMATLSLWKTKKQEGLRDQKDADCQRERTKFKTSICTGYACE